MNPRPRFRRTNPRREQGGELPAALKFLAPNFIGFFIFTAGPILFSFGASLTNWNLERSVPLRFIGLQNYADLWHDNEFWLFLANTVYLMLGMPVAILGSLWIATLLHRKVRGIAIYRTLLYLPSFTSGVAIMLLWKQMLNPDFGAVNDSIRWVLATFAPGRHPELPQWLSSTHNLLGLNVDRVAYDRSQLGFGARDALNLMGVWIAIGGSNMLLYLAALTNVPTELQEASWLDGAGRWASFKAVTWPHLAPTTFFIVVMSIIGGLQAGFETARVMTGGGPARTTMTVAYQIYDYAFERFQIGYASAISWALFAIILVVTLFQWKFGNRGELDA